MKLKLNVGKCMVIRMNVWGKICINWIMEWGGGRCRKMCIFECRFVIKDSWDMLIKCLNKLLEVFFKLLKIWKILSMNIKLFKMLVWFWCEVWKMIIIEEKGWRDFKLCVW